MQDELGDLAVLAKVVVRPEGRKLLRRLKQKSNSQ